MAFPLIPVALSALGGAVGGGLLFGGKKGETKKEMISREYSPTRTDVYSPQSTDARTSSQSLVYQPVVQIESPNATATPSARQEQRQAIQQTPSVSVIPTQERASSPMSQSDASSGLDNKTLITYGLIAGGVVLALNFLK
ncbi:MAG: hypothetical protein ACOC1P_00615 [Minisyncoccales bacterium]